MALTMVWTLTNSDERTGSTWVPTPPKISLSFNNSFFQQFFQDPVAFPNHRHIFLTAQVVPGSHRDDRNPRGPHDGMNHASPIPGEMQVVAPAGSVLMADTRCWVSQVPHSLLLSLPP